MNSLKFFVVLWIFLNQNNPNGFKIDEESYIKCEYFVTSAIECKMDISNFEGRDDFEVIEGKLLNFLSKTF